MALTAPISLKDVKVSTIKPYTKSEHPAILQPAVFDLQVLDNYIPIVFYYKLEKGLQADASRLVERIKESLSKLLVPYFPFAGRWVKTYDGRIRELNCNDEGVPFIEASIEEELDHVLKSKDFVAVEKLGGFQFVGFNSNNFQQYVETPLPSLFVQVTKFNGGSVALHVAFSHMTSDGEGMVRFMKAWSETALHGQTAVVPNHDRSLTTSLAELMRSAGNTEENVTQEEDSTKQSTTLNGSEETRADPGVAFKIPLVEPTISKTLHVRRQVIEDLKREAALENMELTTVDLISAHIWRSLSSIPESVDGRTSSVVGTWVDGRSRFHNPPLPERYSGNAAVIEYTSHIPAKELASNSPLFAADIVHKTVRAINPSNWQNAVLGLVQMVTGIYNSNYRQLMISSWFRFPMYEISFGEGFGKPVNATTTIHSRVLPHGIAIIQPPAPVLSEDAIATIVFIVQKTNGVADALFSDEKFLSFFL